jgi:hypothetical protein
VVQIVVLDVTESLVVVTVLESELVTESVVDVSETSVEDLFVQDMLVVTFMIVMTTFLHTEEDVSSDTDQVFITVTMIATEFTAG